MLSFGTYPEVSLKEAREKRDQARKQIAAEIDPGEHRKAHKTAKLDRAADSFEIVAREWFAKYSPNWAPTHFDKIIRRFEKNLFPWLGSRAIAEITAPELLTALRRIESRGALKLPIVPCRTAARCSAMPWRPGGPSTTHPEISAAPCPPAQGKAPR